MARDVQSAPPPLRFADHVEPTVRRGGLGHTGTHVEGYGPEPQSAVNWLTLVANGLVPVASVVSTATVAIWTKRIDSANKCADRQHELVLDYEKRAGEDKKATLKALISATLNVKRGAALAGAEITEANVGRRRVEALRELYEFRMRLGLDDGVAELMTYAAEPVRELADLMLDEWDRQFRERGYSLAQLDTCMRRLLQTDGGEREWAALKNEEDSWLKKLSDESDLDVDSLVALCDRTLKAAHKDLRGGYGVERA